MCGRFCREPGLRSTSLWVAVGLGSPEVESETGLRCQLFIWEVSPGTWAVEGSEAGQGRKPARGDHRVVPTAGSCSCCAGELWEPAWTMPE